MLSFYFITIIKFLMMGCKNGKNLFILLMIAIISFFSFGEQEVLDLGKIKITGEIRRPNVNLVYSKKYFSKAVSMIAKEKLKEFEMELLKPAEINKEK